MSEDKGMGMDEVRRLWEEEVGMDLSHLTDEEVVDFAERQALVRTPEDLARYDQALREAEAAAEHWEEWRERLAGHLGVGRPALDTALDAVDREMTEKAMQRLREHLYLGPSNEGMAG